MTVHLADPPFKAGTKIPRASGDPDTLHSGQRPIAVATFARLVNALRERDQPAADEARRELRSRGFDVRPIGSPPKRGGPGR